MIVPAQGQPTPQIPRDDEDDQLGVTTARRPLQLMPSRASTSSKGTLPQPSPSSLGTGSAALSSRLNPRIQLTPISMPLRHSTQISTPNSRATTTSSQRTGSPEVGMPVQPRTRYGRVVRPPVRYAQ